MTREPPEPWISQTEHRRVAVEGRLVDGSTCTVLFVQDPDGWLLYPYGLDGGAVRLTGAGVATIAEGLSQP